MTMMIVRDLRLDRETKQKLKERWHEYIERQKVLHLEREFDSITEYTAHLIKKAFRNPTARDAIIDQAIQRHLNIHKTPVDNDFTPHDIQLLYEDSFDEEMMEFSFERLRIESGTFTFREFLRWALENDC